MEMIYKLLRSLKWTCSRFLYMNTLKMRIRKVRQKENIRVLFAVAAYVIKNAVARRSRFMF